MANYGAKPKLKPGNYTTKQVSKMTGATLRQLQWWAERGFIHPEHVGHYRIWTDADVEQIKRWMLIRETSQVSFHDLPKWDGEIRVLTQPTVIEGVLYIPRESHGVKRYRITRIS